MVLVLLYRSVVSILFCNHLAGGFESWWMNFVAFTVSILCCVSSSRCLVLACSVCVWRSWSYSLKILYSHFMLFFYDIGLILYLSSLEVCYNDIITLPVNAVME